MLYLYSKRYIAQMLLTTIRALNGLGPEYLKDYIPAHMNLPISEISRDPLMVRWIDIGDSHCYPNSKGCKAAMFLALEKYHPFLPNFSGGHFFSSSHSAPS